MPDTLTEEQNTLQANLSALKEYYPHIYSVLESDLSTCVITFSGPENKTLNITGNQKEITVSAHQRETAISNIVNPGNSKPIYLSIGLGVGDELQKLYDITQRPIPELPNCKLPIYIVEPEPLMLIAAMHSHDMCTLLESQRVQWFIGEDAPEKIADYFEASRQAIHPTHFITHWYPQDHPIAQASIKAANEATNKSSAAQYQLKIKTNNHYKKITSDEWKDIFTSKNRPLRIMGGTSRFTTFLQYCMRDLLAGFESLGHKTLLHIEESDISRITPHDVLASIDEFKPDVIIYIDHFRDEYPFLPKNIPFVNWIQDLLPNIINPKSRTFLPFDFTYVFAPRWMKLLSDLPAYTGHNIDVLHLGINPEIYHPIQDTEKTFDVLYVSHLVPIEQTLRLIINTNNVFEINPDEKELLDSRIISYDQLLIIYRLIAEELDELLIDELWNYAHTATREPFILRILKKAKIPTEKSIVEHFIKSKRFLNDIVFAIKTRPLTALINQGFDVRIYGHNWNLHSDFSEYSYGPIENGTPLNLLMNQARICLNNSQGVSLHMRALEILGSGSFMISREIASDNSDLREFLTEDEDVFFFKNEADIVHKVEYWLEHETKREQSSSLTHTKALSIFDYKNVAKTIQKSIQGRLPEP